MIQPFLRRCSVDLFASRLTCTPLLPTYASWKPDPGATYTDAMTLDWSLLKKLRLSTIQSDRTSTEKSISGQSRCGPCGPSMADTTLVASPPEPLNQESCHDTKLQTPAEGSCISSEDPPIVPRLHLAVFHLSGNSTKQNSKGFQSTLLEYSNQQLAAPYIRQTRQPGDYGIAGVLN